MDAKTKPITVQTKIKARKDKVWKFWTTPEHIQNWNFASDDWICPEARNNLEVNGEFSYRMESKDGELGFDFEGTYYNILEEELIAYKMADGRSVSIEFLQDEDFTIVTETFEPEDQNSKDLQKNGWQAILDNFKTYVESQSLTD